MSLVIMFQMVVYLLQVLIILLNVQNLSECIKMISNTRCVEEQNNVLTIGDTEHPDI